MRFLIFLLALTSFADDQSGSTSLEALAFMSGPWAQVSDGTRTEEHWTAPAGGIMLATARTVRGGKTVFFEFLRIEQTKDGIAYIAQPRGRPPTAFKLTELTKDKVVFENPEHDFPKKITYWREGQNLCAKTEGEQNGKAVSEQWTFKPATLGAAK